MSVQITNEPTYFPWIRVNLAVECCIKEALVETLHNRHNHPSYTGLPEDETKLFQVMTKCRLDKYHELQQVFKKPQWNIVCPASGKSNSRDWDITKLVAVLRTEVKISPKGGWKRATLTVGDVSVGAYVFLARNLRNAVKHGSIHDISTKSDFNKYWSEINDILSGLSYGNMILFHKLENGPLDKFTASKVDILQTRLFNAEQNISELKANQRDPECGSKSQDLCKEIDILKAALKSYENIKTEIDRNKSHIDGVQTKLENLEVRVLSVEETQNGGTDNITSSEVWQVLRESHDFSAEDWKILAQHFKINYAPNAFIKLWQLHFSDENMEDKIKTYFCYHEISWWSLHKKLKQMGKEDVIDEILAKTNLTTNLNSKFSSYKKQVLDEFSSKFVLNPFLNKHGQVEVLNMQMKDAYVELSILKGAQMDERWSKNDRIYHLESLDMPKESILIDEIFSMNDKFIIISGIAGIGKTMLFNKIVIEWALGNLFKNIKLLLYIKCSELNTFAIKSSETFEETLCRLFPNVFNDVNISFLKLLRERILLLVDSIDEFQWIGELENPQAPAATFLSNLINIKRNQLFGSVIVFGRPSAASCLQSVVRLHFNLNARRVEVCGFLPVSIDAFIEKYVSSTTARRTVHQRINNNKTLQAMVRIPIYLSVICSLFQEETPIPTPETCTELLLYACLVFLRSHFKSVDNKNMFTNLKSLCDVKEILQYIINMAAISFKLILNNKVYFQDTDIETLQVEGNHATMLQDLERTGLIVQSGNGENGSEYQFRHMVLQELFSALHLFISRENIGSNKYYENVNLKSCLPLVAGLEGIYSKSSILSKFVNNLIFMANRELVKTQENSLMEYVSSRFLTQCLTFSYRLKNKNGYLVKTLSLYYECFFEMQGTIPPSIINILHHNIIEEINAIGLNSFQVEQLLYFWQKAADQCLNEITINKLRLNCAKTEVRYLISLAKVTEKFFFRVKDADDKDFNIDNYFKALDEGFCKETNMVLKSVSLRSLHDVKGIPLVALFSVKHLEAIEVFHCRDVIEFLQCLCNVYTTTAFAKLRSVTVRGGYLRISPFPNCFLHLERLVFTKVLLNLDHTIAIANSMKGDQKLRELFLNNCDLTDDMLLPLVSCIKYVKHFCLCGNNLTEKSLLAIGEKLKSLCQSQETFELKMLTLDVIFEDYVFGVFYPKYKEYLTFVDIDFAYGEFDIDYLINY